MSRFFQGLYYDNLGFSSNSSVFTIHGADGRDLSVENPAVVVLPKKSNVAESVKYQVTANQSFEDATGTSDIIGNTFGTTASVAWGNNLPMFIYAVSNDAEDTVQFMIARIPIAFASPPASNIGAPDDPVANAQGSFWSLNNIDETLFDGNPCIAIGSFKFTKDTSDDWTVATINFDDGIGKFNDSRVFVMPISQNGAATGKYFKDNGGTAPSFSTNHINYTLDRFGECRLLFNFSGATAGVGANNCQLAIPLRPNGLYNSTIQFVGPLLYDDDSTSSFFEGTIRLPEGNTYGAIGCSSIVATGSSLQNEDIDSGDGMRAQMAYNVTK